MQIFYFQDVISDPDYKPGDYSSTPRKESGGQDRNSELGISIDAPLDVRESPVKKKVCHYGNYFIGQLQLKLRLTSSILFDLDLSPNQ